MLLPLLIVAFINVTIADGSSKNTARQSSNKKKLKHCTLTYSTPGQKVKELLPPMVRKEKLHAIREKNRQLTV